MLRIAAMIIGFLFMTGVAPASELTHTEDTAPSLSQALATPQKAPTIQGRRLLIPPTGNVVVPEVTQPTDTPEEPRLAAAPEPDKPCPKNPYSGHTPKAKTTGTPTAHGG